MSKGEEVQFRGLLGSLRCDGLSAGKRDELLGRIERAVTEAEREQLSGEAPPGAKSEAAAAGQDVGHRSPAARWLVPSLAAAIAIIVAGVAATWLVRTGPASPDRLPVSLFFPQLLAESMRKLEQVETLVMTVTSPRQDPASRKGMRIYYKAPHFVRREFAGLVDLSDGRRRFGLNFHNNTVRSVGPPSDGLDKLMKHWVLDRWQQQPRKGLVTGPFPDSIDGIPCHRFDKKFPAPGVPPSEAPTCHWFFAVEGGLLLRIQGDDPKDRQDMEYNVPLDDSLFAVPEWAQDVVPTVAKLVVRDGKAQPVPEAAVYFGRLGSLREVRTNATGEAVVDLEAWAHRYEGADNRLIFSLSGDVIVESTDSKLAGLYSLDDLFLVFGEGLREGLPEKLIRRERAGWGSGWPGWDDQEEIKIAVRARPHEEGSSARLTYDPEDNTVSLSMTLCPKAEVFRQPR